MTKKILVGIGLAGILIAFFLPVLGNDSLFTLILQGPNPSLPGLMWFFWIIILALVIITGILFLLKKMGGLLPIGAGIFTILILLYNFMGAIAPTRAIGFNILGMVGIGFWIIFAACILLVTGGVLVTRET